MLEDINTYLALSFTDIDRGIWIYNDNTMDTLIHGKGHKEIIYTCHFPNVNDIKVKLETSVRDEDGNMLAFSDSTQTPVILQNRVDIDQDDKSEMDSATGLLRRNGEWTIQ